MDETTIEVQRHGQWLHLPPKELTTIELCDKLGQIQIESDDFQSPQEVAEGYAAIKEASRRLLELCPTSR